MRGDLVCILGTATYFMWEVGATRFLTIKMYSEYKNEEQFDSLVQVLPEPLDLEEYIKREFNDTLVSVIGEIGLDKLFKTSCKWFLHAEREGKAYDSEGQTIASRNSIQAILPTGKAHKQAHLYTRCKVPRETKRYLQ